MARKKLLTEGEVRQFMKLANLGPLAETYLSHTSIDEQDEEELDMGAELEVPMGDEEVGVEDEVEMGPGEEDPEATLARVVQAVADELGVEVDVEGAGEEGGEELEVDAELEGPGGEEDFEMSAGIEDEEDLPPANMYNEGEPAPQQDPQQQQDTDEEEELRRAKARGQAAKDRVRARGQRRGIGIRGITTENAADHDEIVEEVARRVAERLNADREQEEMASQLAERIFNRLTTK